MCHCSQANFDVILHAEGYGDYSTISLGFAGLHECVVALTGKSHRDPKSKELALAIMRKLNDKADQWKEETNIGFSVYGTPLESTTYKFAKALQSRFGIIEGVTDRAYITNSYHVHVTEKIDAFEKLSFESEFQELSPGELSLMWRPLTCKVIYLL